MLFFCIVFCPAGERRKADVYSKTYRRRAAVLTAGENKKMEETVNEKKDRVVTQCGHAG